MGSINVLSRTQRIIVHSTSSVSVINAGPPGPPGPPGSAGTSSNFITREAGFSVSVNRVVVLGATGEIEEYASQDDPTHVFQAKGITLNAATAGDDVNVTMTGEHTEAGWSWTPEALLYLGTNGVITQTPPTTGFLQVLGYAETATRIIFDPQPPLILS